MDNRPRSLLPALLASAVAMVFSPSQKFHRERGKAPKGKRWVNSSAFVPGGPHANVRGTFVRNPKIAAQINAMHDVIEFARLVRQSA